MTQAVRHNIRLAVLVAVIIAGVAVQKQAHNGQHADCVRCIEASAVL